MSPVPLLALLLLLPQEVPEATSRPADPTRARRLLEAASKSQVPDGNAPVLDDFQADLEVTIYQKNPDGGRPIPQSARVTEFWRRTRRGAYYRRDIRKPDGKRVIRLSGPKGPWMRNETGETFDLNERAHESERKMLQDEIARVQQLVDSFFVARLLADAKTLRVTREGVAVPLESGPVVADEIEIIRPDSDPLRLLISRDKHYVVGVRIRPDTPREDRLLFDYHRMSVSRRKRGKDKGKELRCIVPTRIEFYERGRHALSASARDPSMLKFNTSIGRKIFSL